jgi:hypothetical protein
MSLVLLIRNYRITNQTIKLKSIILFLIYLCRFIILYPILSHVLWGGNTSKSRMSSGLLFSGKWQGSKIMDFIVDALTTRNLFDSLPCCRKGSNLFTVFLYFSLFMNCCMPHTTSVLPYGYTVSAKSRTFAG